MSVSGAAGRNKRGAHGRRDRRLSAERWRAARDRVGLRAREGPSGLKNRHPSVSKLPRLFYPYLHVLFGKWVGGKVEVENLVAWGAKAGCSDQFPGGRVQGTVIDLGEKRAKRCPDRLLQGE